MDWPTHLTEVARWLVTLASTPGWLEYAKRREEELTRSPMYAELPEFIRRERNARKGAPDAAA